MFLTRPPLATHSIATAVLPLDLHVLGLPPAFTLSQDQTLQLKLPTSCEVKTLESDPKLL